jgi:predicted membrane channel-forming protein YqfA (hemolysin III family)
MPKKQQHQTYRPSAARILSYINISVLLFFTILSLSRRVFNSPVISTFTIFIQPLGTLAVFSLLNYTVIVEDPI